ncbi:MAG: sigma 54-interacting transcriptional regulator [Alphaproteobacteria bacterium]|nr:sigma 54-interacting transcriptional regulator [Alphaproteobacteria bacterium]
MAHLIFRRGDTRIVDYRLRPGPTTIGRADSCDVALPGGEISRTHCIVQSRDDGWELVDRSRHGVTVDGEPVKRALLADGARIGLGPYEVEFKAREQPARPTDEVVGERNHEIILATDDAGLHVQRAVVHVVAGPDAGRRLPVKSGRIGIGSAGSSIALRDDGLQRDHVRLRFVRGRVLVEPGEGAAWVDGARVREIMPLYLDEELVLGSTVLKVAQEPLDEQPSARQLGDMVADSAAMLRVFGTLRRFAGHHFPVLITGESGTGKELAARGLHDVSARAGGAWVAVNCGAIAENLFESELFGHEKGAFTGADKKKDGAFHRAHGGTLFLDEIGELPEPAQAKLLRALESGEVRRVGSTDVEYPDVRIVAATNRDLPEAVRAGVFREDLFFRLAVLSVQLPPLRARIEDLPSLTAHLCRRLHPECHVTDDALAMLSRHRWPGNVRELRNVLTRAFVMAGPVIDAQDLTFHDLGMLAADSDGPPNSLDEAERGYIRQILDDVGGNRSAAARALGIARSTLHYKMQRLGID